VIDLDKVPKDDPSLSPMQLWCNESQERYVLGLPADRIAEFAALCERERCPFAVVGYATAEEHLVVGYGATVDNAREAGRDWPIDLPMDVLFGKPPKMHRDTRHPPAAPWPELEWQDLDLRDAALRVLAHPTVASKNFLVTIGDRTVGGLTARDQMIGPWQLPMADCAITLSGFDGVVGEAMAIGERTPLALLDAAAAARMAVGEAITNLCAAPVESLARIKLSATGWPPPAIRRGRAAVRRGQGRGHGTVPAARPEHPGRQGLAVDAGAVAQRRRGAQVRVAGVADRQRLRAGPTCASSSRRCCRARRSELWLIGLGAGKQRMGGSILAQCFPEAGNNAAGLRRPFADRDDARVPDLDDPQRLRAFFELIRDARMHGLLRAYTTAARRRPRHVVRNGVLFARGPRHQSRRLGRGSVPHAGSTKNSAPSYRSPARPRRIRRPGFAPRPDRLRAAHRQADRRADDPRARPTAARWPSGAGRNCSTHGGHQPRAAEASRQPGMRRRGARRRARLLRDRIAAEAGVRPG
jgi:phosphoribosylformylglycinamidine synthase